MLTLILTLVLVGVILYIVPMDDRIKLIICAVVAILVVLYLFQMFGFHDPWPMRRPYAP